MTDTATLESTGGRRAASERRRQAILEAARNCFGREGYAGATVARIAEEAGVSHGLLYQFFKNKEELFDTVLRDVVRDWVRAMLGSEGERGATDADASAADALEGMFRRSVEFCRSHPLLPALMSADPALQLERLKGAAKDRVEPHRELVAGILERGVASDELAPDLDVAAAADVICHLHGEYSRRAYSNDPMYPLTPAIIDEAVRFIRARIERRAS